MRNSKTLELFENMKNEFEKEEVLKESEEKLYVGRKAEVKRDVEDTDLHKGDIVTVNSTEVDVDGWDSDYVNVTRESDGKEFSGVSSYELNLLIDESEVLEEKINKDNIEINNKIRQSLRSKREARKNEPELAKHGIKVNYDNSQGTRLIGPNGKRLFDDKNNVYGPSVPGFNDTHQKPDNYYAQRAKDYKARAEEYTQKAKQLKDMSRDDIIRKYNDKTTEEALAAHKEQIKKYEDWAKEYENDVARYTQDSTLSARRAKKNRREGHEKSPRSGYNDPISKNDGGKNYKGETIRPSTADKVDYLNYLTKKPTGYRIDDSRDYREGNAYRPEDDMNKHLRGYIDLKNDIGRAEENLRFYNDYYKVKSEEDMKKKAEEIRAKAEEDIKKANADNEENRAKTKDAQERVDNAKKAAEDYMKNIRDERANKTAK